MIKRSAVVYFVIFLVVAAVAIYLQRGKDNTHTSGQGGFATLETSNTPVPVPTMEYLFPAEQGAVISIFIESRDGKSLALERQNGVWAATQPIQAEAIQSSVEEAASQILALQVIDRLDLPNADVGLDAPAYTLTIGFSSGSFVIAQVGEETPSGNGYYVRKETGPVLVVGKYGLLALINLLDFPPYVPSATPAITETPAQTSTPTLAPSATPAPATASETPTATKAP